MIEPPAGPPNSPVELVYARPIRPAGSPRLDLSMVAVRDAALDVLLVLLVALGVPVGMQATMLLFGVEDDPATAPPPESFAAFKWLEALLVVSLAAYFVYRQRVPAASLGLRLDGLGRQFGWGLVGLVGVYAVMVPVAIVMVALVMLLPGLEQDLEHRREFMEFLPLDNLPVTILLLAAVAIHEELLFRGLLLPYLRRLGLGWVGAVAVSSVLFASLHLSQGVLGALQILPVAVALAATFILSRSLLAVIVAHFLFDLLQTQLVRFVLPWAERVMNNT